MYISVALVDASNVLANITFQLPSITLQNIRQGWTLDLWLVFDPCLFQETVTWLEFPRKLWYVGVAFDSLLQNIRLEKSPSKIAFLKYTPLKQIVQCTTLISRMTILFQRIIIPYQHQPTMSQGSRNWFANSASSILCPDWSRGSFLEGSLFHFVEQKFTISYFHSNSLLEMYSAFIVGVFWNMLNIKSQLSWYMGFETTFEIMKLCSLIH